MRRGVAAKRAEPRFVTRFMTGLIAVVLIVIFARVVVGTVDSGKSFEWSMLVLPASILMIAVALRMIELAGGKGHGGNDTSEGSGH